MVCATELALLSTSEAIDTPLAYLGLGRNVMWRLLGSAEDDAGYHMGADVAMLSQFDSEKEVLFPPLTMLSVLPSAADDGSFQVEEKTDGEKTYQCITCRATFV